MANSGLQGENKELCKTIFNQAKIINAQINDILDSNLHNDRQIIPNLTVVRLDQIVTETIALLTDEAEHHQLRLIYSGPLHSSKFKVKTDSVRAQQVLINLIKNAIKFSEPHGKVQINLKYLKYRNVYEI